MTAGITHKGTTIPGLVEDLQWGEWDRPVQYHAVFGLAGVSALDGARKLREFHAPMMIYGGYVSESALYSALGTFDGLTGNVGTYVERNLSDAVVRTIADVEFVGLQLLFTRHDPVLGYWAKATLKFRQLKPS